MNIAVLGWVIPPVANVTSFLEREKMSVMNTVFSRRNLLEISCRSCKYLSPHHLTRSRKKNVGTENIDCSTQIFNDLFLGLDGEGVDFQGTSGRAHQAHRAVLGDRVKPARVTTISRRGARGWVVGGGRTEPPTHSLTNGGFATARRTRHLLLGPHVGPPAAMPGGSVTPGEFYGWVSRRDIQLWRQ